MYQDCQGQGPLSTRAKKGQARKKNNMNMTKTYFRIISCLRQVHDLCALYSLCLGMGRELQGLPLHSAEEPACSLQRLCETQSHIEKIEARRPSSQSTIGVVQVAPPQTIL